MTSWQIFALILGNAIANAAPVVYGGLAGVVSEKSGVVNIGIEGMMTIGAMIAVTVGLKTGNPRLAFLCGGLAGLVFGLIHAIVSVTYAGDQTISGIAINYLAPGLALFLSRLFFDGATLTPSIPIEQKMPKLFSGMIKDRALSNIFSQYATVYLALAFVIFIYIFLFKTRKGLRVIAVGEHPEACETLNIPVKKIRYRAVMASGFLAGLGGASMSLAVVSSFSPTLIAGQGYIALVTVIFGNRNPRGALLGGIFFGFAKSIATYIGGTAVALPAEFISMIPYIATLLILIIFHRKSRPPKADGVPYLTENI